MVHINESELKNIIRNTLKETLTKALHEEMSPEDKWVADEEADEEMRYDMGELTKAFQKSNGTYQATSRDGKFKTGDKVVVHTRKGDIQGVISDFSENFMTYKETADVDFEEDGKTKTLIGCPLDKIEKLGNYIPVEQLCHSKNPLTRKRANFAKMAKRGWKPLNEGIFDMFKKKRNEPMEQNNEQEQNHVYSVKELQSLCDNQLNITPFERKVLNAALWVRARQANYHGYAKQWSNIMAKDGELYYWDKGKLKRVP